MCDFEKLGYRIYEARSISNMKQSDVCNKLGISQSMYSKIESGKYDMKLSTLYQLSSILNVSVAWLLGENSITDLTDKECLEIEKFKQYIISTRKMIDF